MATSQSMQIKEVQVLLFLILIKTTKVKSERNLKKNDPINNSRRTTLSGPKSHERTELIGCKQLSQTNHTGQVGGESGQSYVGQVMD